MAERPTYWDYLRLEELLSLQGGIGGDEGTLGNDEVRFLVIHQIDELWFKLVLRELQATRDLFGRSRVPETSLAAAAASLRRVALIFSMLADHFRLMETMRTQDYLSFRDKLSPASGFQSAQMREIEILIGLKDEDRLRFGEEDSYLDALAGEGNEPSTALARVKRRQAEPSTLKDAVYSWLRRTPIQGSTPDDQGDAEVVAEFLDEFLARHEGSIDAQMREALAGRNLAETEEEGMRARFERQRQGARVYLGAEDIEPAEERARVRRLRAAILFIGSFRQLPLLSWPGEIVDGLIEAEQAMLIFRQRHARMVERVIGRRVGTGGSAGVEYLDATALRYRVFTEIWAARTLLLQPDLAPPLRHAEFYELRSS